MTPRRDLSLLIGLAILARGGSGATGAELTPPTVEAAPRAATTPPPLAPAPGSTAVAARTSWPPPPLAFQSGATSDTDLLLLPAARRPPARSPVIAATRVAAPPKAIGDVLLNPGAMRMALPALVRADVVATRPGPHPDGWPDRLLAWEVEIPLFNLSGRAWLHQHDDGAELTLIEGAFAPGRIRFRVAPVAPAGGNDSMVTCEVQLEPRSAGFILRRVARHDPWSEVAVSAATSWVLLRALAQQAEAGRGRPTTTRRPTTAIAAPNVAALDAAPLRQAALQPLRAAGTLASIRRAPGGRLAWASVAIAVSGPPAAIGPRLIVPETWRVYPGWKAVKRRAGGAPTVPGGGRPAAVLVDVNDDISFVDFDAVWSVDAVSTTAVRATAIEGDTRGAVFAWDARAGDIPNATLATLAMHPRLDAAGYIERKMIAAEPLLEHAFAIALAYVDAAAVADSLRH